MTDNEIKKALECCDGSFDKCGECPLDSVNQDKLRCWELEKSALDLINRLQAENERLKNCVKSEDEVRDIAKRTMEPLVKEITREQIDIAVKQAKVEAYKECVEKVKEIIPAIDDTYIESMVEEHLDNLLKELIGENNETKTF